MPGVGVGGRIAPLHRIDEAQGVAGVADASGPPSVAHPEELPVPARCRQPDFHLDVGIGAGRERGGDPAEGGRPGRGRSRRLPRAPRARRDLELSGGDRLCHGDGRVRQHQLRQAFARDGRRPCLRGGGLRLQLLLHEVLEEPARRDAQVLPGHGSVVGELQVAARLCIEPGPRGKPVAVGIAGPGVVGPVGLHVVGDLPLRIGHLARREVAEDVTQLPGMLRTVLGFRERMRELIGPDHVARRGMEGLDGQGRAAVHGVGDELSARVPVRGIVGRVGVQLHGARGQVSVEIRDGLLESVRATVERALPRVAADQQWDLLLLSRRERPGGYALDHVAVGNGPETQIARALQQILDRRCSQVGDSTGGGRARLRRERDAGLFGLGQGGRQPTLAHHRSALLDRAREKVRAQRRDQQLTDVVPTRRLPEERHVGRVSAEPGDVLLDPLESGDQVEEGVVPGGVMRGFGCELRMRQEPEDPESVLDRDDDHPVPRQALAVERRLDATGAQSRAAGVAAAVDPHHHGLLRRGRPLRRPDVEEETVFLALDRRVPVPVSIVLRAGGSVLSGVAHTGPGVDGHGWFPPQVADGRRGEGNPLEHSPAVEGPAADLASCNRHRRA